MVVGLMTLAHKRPNVMETRSIDNDTTQSGGVAAGAVMTLLGQNSREAQRLMGPVVAPKENGTAGA